jgi:hypothetical protein
MELVQIESKLEQGDTRDGSSGKEHIQDIQTDSKPEVGEVRGDWDGIEPMEVVVGDEPMEAASGEGESGLAQSSASRTVDCSTLRGLGEANNLLVGSQFKAKEM